MLCSSKQRNAARTQPNYLPTYLLTYLLTHLLTYLLTYSLAYLPTYLPTYLLAYFFTFEESKKEYDRRPNTFKPLTIGKNCSNHLGKKGKGLVKCITWVVSCFLFIYFFPPPLSDQSNFFSEDKRPKSLHINHIRVFFFIRYSFFFWPTQLTLGTQENSHRQPDGAPIRACLSR